MQKIAEGLAHQYTVVEDFLWKWEKWLSRKLAFNSDASIHEKSKQSIRFDTAEGL